MAIPLTRRLAFSEIPQIDAAPLFEEDLPSATVGELARACEEVGFFYVANHGVPAKLIEDVRSAAGAFFERPMDEKMLIRLDQRMRGYLPLDYSSYEGEDRAAKSHQEGFWMSYERSLDETRPMHGPNLWPKGHPALRSSMEAYFAAAERLANALLRGFSAALGQAPDTLGQYFAAPQTMLKLNHYPPQDSPQSIKHIGVVPHTDSGAFTILWQDEGDGLEIQNKDGEWIGAPLIPGTFVINIGNVMQTWSKGRFSSTPHRVINRGGRDRYSIPMFVNPGHEAPVGPMAGDAIEADEVFGDYIRDIWRRTFPVAEIP
ncbi:MAG: 2OG-Fe(II) oxygenase family protein [Pseudomonadota bacterium]